MLLCLPAKQIRSTFGMKLKGITLHLLLLGIGPAFLIVTVLSFYFIENQINYLEQSLQERGNIIVRQAATASIYGILSKNNLILQELANNILQEKDVVSVRIDDSQGNYLAGAKLVPLPRDNLLTSFASQVILSSLQHKIRGYAPTSSFTGDQAKDDKHIGTVHVQLSLQNTLETKHDILINSLIITAAGLLITALITIRLGSIISVPITKLTQAVNRISEGNMDARAEFIADAELEDLRIGFNSMAIGLQQTQQYLEQQIENATDQLRYTLNTLEQKNLSLENARKLAVTQNKIKSQFLAHISHEIRTPMSGIIGFAELLSKTNLSAKQREYIQLVKSSAANLMIIVNEILDHSSLESGKFKINFIGFNFRSCLEDSVSLLSTQSTKIPIILDINEDVPAIINNDPIRLQQVLTNLLGNAIKFTQHGHIIIRCRQLEQHSLLISISDTGPGIAQQHQQQLFSPFLQISEYTLNHEVGTGLGLTISKNIVERLKGKIGLITQENVGSTFWFTIPVISKKQEEITASCLQVILIDQFKLRRNAFHKQLEHLGYTVYSFDSVAAFIKNKPDLLDVIFFAPPKHTNFSSHLHKTLNLIKLITQVPIILLQDQTNKSMQIENHPILTLPCRSAFLASLLNSILNREPETLPLAERESVNHSFAILIADDNEINRLLFKSQLDNRFTQITLAATGSEALEYLQSKQFDLVLLDLQMPGISGMEIIRIIKSSKTINCDAPIIAVTAHAQQNQRKEVITAGFDECLIKPVFPEQLNEILNLWQFDITETLPDATLQSSNNDYVAILLEKTQNNRDLTISLFEKLFEELPQQVKDIEAALKINNLLQAQEINHKLTGSAGFCGLIEIQQAADKMEFYLSEDNLVMANKYFSILKFHVNSFIKLKESIFNQLNGVSDV
jgi:two-component system, NarL family, sensor histidine kinase BarA